MLPSQVLRPWPVRQCVLASGSTGPSATRFLQSSFCVFLGGAPRTLILVFVLRMRVGVEAEPAEETILVLTGSRVASLASNAVPT